MHEIARMRPKTTQDKRRTTHHTTNAHARTTAEEKRAANDAKKKKTTQCHPPLAGITTSCIDTHIYIYIYIYIYLGCGRCGLKQDFLFYGVGNGTWRVCCRFIRSVYFAACLCRLLRLFGVFRGVRVPLGVFHGVFVPSYGMSCNVLLYSIAYAMRGCRHPSYCNIAAILLQCCCNTAVILLQYCSNTAGLPQQYCCLSAAILVACKIDHHGQGGNGSLTNGFVWVNACDEEVALYLR
jgi:hypothetical protein